MKSTPRKILLWLITAIVSLLVLVLAMPLWFPWLLRPLGRRAGLHYQTYVREGYSRFNLGSVSYTNAHVHLTAWRIRLFVPSTWAWHRFRSDKTLRYAEVTDWNLLIIPGSTGQPHSESSTYTNAQKIGAIISKVDHWLPAIILINGTVELLNRTVQIGQFDWQNRRFQLAAKPAGLPSSMRLEGRLSGETRWQLQANYAPLHLQAQMQAVNSTSNLLVSGAVFFETNRFDCNARFARTSSLPQQASVTCNSFSIPAGLVNLENYSDIKGALSLLWNRDSFAGEVSANAAPVADSKLPPMDVRLRARSDLHQAQIEQLKIAIPGIQAEIANRITFPMSDPAPPAILHIAANLAQQPWVPVEGAALGEVQLTPGTNWVPAAAFNVSGTNISNSQFKAKNISVAGTLNWPWVELQQCRAEFLPQSAAEIRWCCI